MNKLMQPFTAALALAFALAIGPASSMAQSPTGQDQSSRSNPKVADPFAGGSVAVQISDAQGCTRDDHTLAGDIVIEASLSDLQKRGPGKNPSEEAMKILTDQHAMDKLSAEWNRVSHKWTSKQIEGKATSDKVFFDVWSHLRGFADKLTDSTGIHFRIKSGGFQVTNDGPGCSLRQS